MLKMLDVLFTILHVAIILFNLFGWMFRARRKLHLISVFVTAASWFILGIWFGIGYCPLTDWQWTVKAKLGEHNLPSNFIEYAAEKISGMDFSTQLVNILIGVFFAVAVVLSFYVNFFRRRTNN
jgi:hypothetical protein